MKIKSGLLGAALVCALVGTGINVWYFLPRMQARTIQPSVPSPAKVAKSASDALDSSAAQAPVVAASENREAGREALGRYLAQRASQSDWSGLTDVPGVEIWPDVVRIMACRERGVEVSSVLDEESALIDAYLFGDEERCRHSLDQLSRVLCYETLDREYYKCSDAQHAEHIKAYCCPVGGTHYEVAQDGLYCPYHQQTLAWPDRTQKPRLEEVYPQLCMGYFNAQRTHRLDSVILGQGMAAVKPGETVVDVGCGVGCYIWAMQRGVGESGRVIACDVQPSVLEFVLQVAKQKGINNVGALHATYDNPGLAPGSVDCVYMIDMLNTMIGNAVVTGGELRAENSAYLAKLALALKDNGRLVVVDFLPAGDRPHVPPEITEEVMGKFGLKLLEKQDVPVEPGAMYALTFGKPKR